MRAQNVKQTRASAGGQSHKACIWLVQYVAAERASAISCEGSGAGDLSEKDCKLIFWHDLAHRQQAQTGLQCLNNPRSFKCFEHKLLAP